MLFECASVNLGDFQGNAMDLQLSVNNCENSLIGDSKFVFKFGEKTLVVVTKSDCKFKFNPVGISDAMKVFGEEYCSIYSFYKPIKCTIQRTSKKECVFCYAYNPNHTNENCNHENISHMNILRYDFLAAQTNCPIFSISITEKRANIVLHVSHEQLLAGKL